MVHPILFVRLLLLTFLSRQDMYKEIENSLLFLRMGRKRAGLNREDRVKIKDQLLTLTHKNQTRDLESAS